MDHKPRKAPAQSRSGATVQAILQAAARILDDRGTDGFNTNAVAQLAGVSIGSLYQYFPSKQAIVLALLKEKRMRMLAKLNASFVNAVERPLGEELLDVSRSMVEEILPWAKLSMHLEQLELSMIQTPDMLHMKLAIRDAVAGFLARKGFENAERLAQDMIGMTKGMVDAASLFGEKNVEQVSARLRDALMGYLHSGQKDTTAEKA